ncbi:MAG: hypothetical protein OQL19_20800 [Gammaproteobacteria bacterium]|nr:hypothetical protein [Gammaproteobacteria bacterium]
MQISNEEKFALEHFVLKVTIPLLIDNEEYPVLHATGTLFEIQGRYFIITARHIFKDITDPKLLAYPESPQKGRIYTLGTLEIFKPTEEHIDVAAIELKSSETIEILRKNWQFLSLDNVAQLSAQTEDSHVFLSGYPAQLTNNSEGWVKSKFSTAYTQRIPDVPTYADKPIIEGMDHFFDYGKEATSITGEVVNTPKLPGTSGASVWELKESTGIIWSPESAARVIGIQSSYTHSKYFRAKNWLAVAKVLEKVDVNIAEAVKSKVNEI